MSGFKTVNGWSRLDAALGRRPDLVPYDFVIQGVKPDILAGTTSVEVYEGIVPSDGELYVLATTLGVTQDEAPGSQGFSAGDFENTPTNMRPKVLITEGKGGKALSDKPVNVGTIFGHSRRPFYWPVPIIWRGGTRVRIELFNRHDGSTDNVNLWFAFHGFLRLPSTPALPVDWMLEPRLVPFLRRRRPARVEPFVYALNFEEFEGRVGFAGDSRTFTVPQGAFAWVYYTISQHDPAQLPYTFKWPHQGQIQFVLNQGNDPMMSHPLAITSMHGHGGMRPWRLPWPCVVEAGQDFSVIMTDDQAGLGTNLEIETYHTFTGVRLWEGSA